MNRKDFLKRTALLSLYPFISGGLGSCLSTTKLKDRVIVFVQLAGGNDGLNTLIPVDAYPELAKVRGNLLIKEKKTLTLKGASQTVLHPALSGLRDLYESGLLQFIQQVGYTNQSYSHFKSTDIYLTGSNQSKNIDSGWMARYFQTTAYLHNRQFHDGDSPMPLSIKIGGQSTALFQGDTKDFGVVFDPKTGSHTFNKAPDHSEYNLDKSKAKLDHITSIMEQSKAYSPSLDRAMRMSINHSTLYGNDSTNPLADQLKAVVKMIASGMNSVAYHVELSGFDTHQNQVDSSDTSKGIHANLLSNLSCALSGFWDDLIRIKKDKEVMCVVFSEFGRRIASNASFGSDHGSCQPIILLGNYLTGGVTGVNPTFHLSGPTNENLEKQFEFGAVFSSILEQWLNLPPELTSSVIPGNFQSIPIIRA